MISYGSVSPYRWQRKPPAGTRLDFSHPLTKGLIAFWPFNEGGGRPADVVNGVLPSTFSNFSWSTSSVGVSGKFSSTKLGYAGLPPCGPAMSFVIVYSTTSYALNQMIIERANVNATWQIFIPANASWRYCGGSGTTRATYALSTAQSALNSLVVCGMTDNGTTAANAARLYLNGNQVAVGNLGAVPASNKNNINIGFYDPANYQLSGTVYFAGVWNRQLSAAEHYFIGSNIDNIWQIFKPQINLSPFLYKASNIIPSTNQDLYSVLLGNRPLTMGRPSLLRR